VLIYRAELAVSLGDADGRAGFLAEAAAIELTDGERTQLAGALARAGDFGGAT
jgi:hypothetical protein